MADIQKALELQSNGQYEEAKQIYLEFLKEEPEQPDISNLLGLIYLNTGELTLAKQYLKTALKGFRCADFCRNMGLVYYKEKNYDEAIKLFDEAISYESDNVYFIRDFAKLAQKAQLVDYCIKLTKRCLELDPKDTIGMINLGLMYEKKYDMNSAKKCYINSLKIKKSYEALHNLGILYRNEGNYTESEKCIKEALKYNPNNVMSHLSLGMTYLIQKDFENGYKHYMKKKPEVAAMYKNHWDGAEHKDKTLLVYYDSGFGDQIMFCRYLNLVKDKFKEVKFFCSHELGRLFTKNFPDIKIIHQVKDDYDYSDNVMYLNYHLGLDFEHIPFSDGYLNAEISKDECFNTPNKKIGLFWQGNYDGYSNRAIKLKELAPLLTLENCTFYGFTKDDKDNQIAEFPQIINTGKDLKDFYDTATKLKALDLFITIDTAAANLAGALGVKTLFLLPKVNEWRWFSDTKTTPWYSSFTIYKQKEDRNWQPVIEEILQDLKKSF